MRKTIRMLTRGVVAAALLTLGFQIRAEAQTGLPGTTLWAEGTTVFVTFVESNAGYNSDIQFFATVGGVSQTLFNNRVAGGTQVTLTVPVGQEVIFGIYVQNTGETFYIGDGSRNSDGLVHAKVLALGNGTYQLGFEDLKGGGDNDFDDVIFEVQGVSAVVNPEPVTMLLLGSGLFGLGGAAARRRRKGELG